MSKQEAFTCPNCPTRIDRCDRCNGTVIVYRGARSICDAVGEDPKNINELVKDQRLPAWKSYPKGIWRALPEDLHRWIREQRDKNIQEYKN